MSQHMRALEAFLVRLKPCFVPTPTWQWGIWNLGEISLARKSESTAHLLLWRKNATSFDDLEDSLFPPLLKACMVIDYSTLRRVCSNALNWIRIESQLSMDEFCASRNISKARCGQVAQRTCQKLWDPRLYSLYQHQFKPGDILTHWFILPILPVSWRDEQENIHRQVPFYYSVLVW